MSYTPPYLDDSGLHIDTYYNLRDQLITDCKNIYGQDIYLENDSQDYQWIANFSQYIYDVLQLAQLVYNNRAPNTAIKAALDSIVKINGIKRKAETYSTCPVTLVGIAGTVITNGIALDKGNIKWDLPSSVTIGTDGTLGTTVTCEIAGPIVANPGDIIGIFNPTYGWNGISNSVSAELGSNIETDTQLRRRQSSSTAQPSKTVLEGTAGAVFSLADVTRSETYENDTDIIDTRGLPPHSITVVAEGGTDTEVAQAICAHKGPGCYTNGNVIVQVADSKGKITPIRFYRPTYVDMDVTINLKALTGYTTATTTDIKNYSQAYLNELNIGGSLIVSSLYGTVLQTLTDLKSPSFAITSITAGRHGQSQVNDEIILSFNEVCRGNINYITVNVT